MPVKSPIVEIKTFIIIMIHSMLNKCLNSIVSNLFKNNLNSHESLDGK